MGKLQHYVWRAYLRAWAHKEKIYCLQDGTIRNPNIKGVGAENYFYRLRELSHEDVEFLRKVLVADSPEGLKPTHEKLLQDFTAPHLVKRKLEALGLGNSEAMVEVDRMIVELNEMLHTSIEEDFQPHLSAMISGDLSFLEDPNEAAKFYRGLAVQYARTNHIKMTQIAMEPDQLALYLRIANPLVHIVAINVGRSLYADRKRHRILLVDNTTDIPFITGDQPAINLATRPRDVTPPEKLEIYYPLSPSKAMLLLEPDSEFLPRESSVSQFSAHLYNLRMAAHSYRQVFSNLPRVLESVRDDLGAYMSCFPSCNSGE